MTADPMKVDLADLRAALGDVSNPERKPCPLPRVLRPCERPAPSRVSRLAPNLIAALIGFCAGADPSFEAFERDRERGRR
jgi:hypothetical protein